MYKVTSKDFVLKLNILYCLHFPCAHWTIFEKVD